MTAASISRNNEDLFSRNFWCISQRDTMSFVYNFNIDIQTFNFNIRSDIKIRTIFVNSSKNAGDHFLDKHKINHCLRNYHLLYNPRSVTVRFLFRFSMSNIYLDKLDEQEDQMRVTHTVATDIINSLEELVGALERKETTEGLETLKVLKSKNDELLKSIAVTRVLQINSSEIRANLMKDPDLTASKIFLSSDDRDDPNNLFNYFEETKGLHEAWMRHLSLVANLSDDLVHKLESSDESNKVLVNKNPLPAVLKETVKQYEEIGDEQQRIENIRAKLFQYLDEIKAGRAKYALENKYILNSTLQQITKEVSEWSQRWTHIENSLFGDSPTSLKKLVQKAENIKELLTVESTDYQME